MAHAVREWTAGCSPEQLCASLLGREPLAAFLGGERFAMVATRLDEQPWDEFCALPWPTAASRGALPFYSGYVGCVSYDDYAGGGDGPRSRVFRVRQAVVYDLLARKSWVVGEGDIELPASSLGSPAALTLVPRTTSLQYRERVAEVIEDIRSGRYYQLNLLRYFDVQCANWPDLLARLCHLAEPMSSLFQVAGLDLVSFSPERFVAITPLAAGQQVTTQPIKGTAPRGSEDLEHSVKDLAELHMIVDLMRHDLAKVSETGSVQVLAANELRRFAAVNHLQATISSRLRRDVSVGEVLAGLCPAGSITGAPKREVMTAIREYEGRPRGFFMGNAFLLDDSGRFDSSVLIRTMQNIGAGWEFAAGSGLTVRSDAIAEDEEIAVKGMILTKPVVEERRRPWYSGATTAEGDSFGCHP